jgi:hypothetical protein
MFKQRQSQGLLTMTGIALSPPNSTPMLRQDEGNALKCLFHVIKLNKANAMLFWGGPAAT